MDNRHGTARIPFVDLVAQYAAISDELDEAALRVMRRADAILGEDVFLFEQEFAAYCGTGYAVGVDSGTSALELALRAFGVGSGDEVVTAANTFIATALAISYTGATPVLADVDERTYTLDPERLEEAMTDRTKAVIPVHLYGQPADMDPICDIARRRRAVVIEDACQAHGATYKGRPVGSLGNAAAFSFYPAKNLGAYGDGGMVVTDDPGVEAAIRMLRNYGQAQKYHHVVQGFNRRLDTLQAAVLRVKLRYLDRWNAARRDHAALYRMLLDTDAIVHPVEAEYARSVYHLYPIRVRDRSALRSYLNGLGIDTGIHYPVPVHLQPAYRNLGYGVGSFPVSERCADEVLSLPMYPELTPEQVELVGDSVARFLAAGERAPRPAQPAA